MKKIKFLSNRYFLGTTLILAGFFVGWLIFHRSGDNAIPGQVQIGQDEAQHTIWTCAMHPQIRMDKPGKCPICGMDLIPLQKTGLVMDNDALSMSEAAMKLAEVQTTIVGTGKSTKNVMLYGKIQPDERLLQSQASHVPGRIEQLFVNFTGDYVKKGQLLARVYSPELVTAQKELLEARNMASKYPAVLEAAREKLRNWKLSEDQIQEIEQSGRISMSFDIVANATGIVISRNVNQGDYVSTGQELYQVADLSKVWAVFDAYESDLPWIALGQDVEFTSQALPGRIFHTTVSFVDPVMEPSTRIARVRAEVSNPGMELKPEMFLNGTIRSVIQGNKANLTVPKSAVLWTGKRSIVYVKIPGADEPTFKMREITLGPSTEDSYIVKDGLQVGEEVVTNGTFSVDAAAQLAGKPSMMNPVGGPSSAGSMPGMDMGAPAQTEGDRIDHKTASREQTGVPDAFKKQLTELFEAYIPMKNSFVNSDPGQVKEKALTVEKKMDAVNMELLSGNNHMMWMDDLEKLKNALQAIESSNDIEQQREGFSKFSDAFYHALKEFGLSGDTAYYQYCPMAFGNKGAYWLSEIREIKNPYFGDAMLKCGETRDTLTH